MKKIWFVIFVIFMNLIIFADEPGANFLSDSFFIPQFEKSSADLEFSLLLIEPSNDINYKLIEITPDQDINYTIMILNPDEDTDLDQNIETE
jgi:hypothetical protein